MIVGYTKIYFIKNSERRNYGFQTKGNVLRDGNANWHDLIIHMYACYACIELLDNA